MKKLTILICFIGLSFSGFSQSTTEPPKFFAQCMLNIEDETIFRSLEDELRANPYVQVVRLDWTSKRAFLLTKELTSFTVEEFQGWLGTNVSSASCFQVGLHGTDQVNPFPFTNCD